MQKRMKLIASICLIAEAFTSLVLSFVYANRKKELSKVFLGLGLVSGLGGAYLMYTDFMEAKKAKELASDEEDWDPDFCECCDEDFFDEGDADDINFTIAEEEEQKEEPEEAKE